jgi:competence protein ComEC
MLWPDEQIHKDDDLSDNDTSLVSLIEFAGAKILLCSDIEKFAQRELLRIHPDLQADVVVIPHHGSARTLGVEFLERLDTDVQICSCGRSQYERTKRDLDLVGSVPNNARSFYTPKDGAVSVCVKEDGTIKADVFVK